MRIAGNFLELLEEGRKEVRGEGEGAEGVRRERRERVKMRKRRKEGLKCIIPEW